MLENTSDWSNRPSNDREGIARRQKVNYGQVVDALFWQELQDLPNLLLPECMHTQSGSFKVYHFSAWYGVIFVVAAAFHVAVAPFLFSYAKACCGL